MGRAQSAKPDVAASAVSGVADSAYLASCGDYATARRSIRSWAVIGAVGSVK
jgi:hypothetical protein